MVCAHHMQQFVLVGFSQYINVVPGLIRLEPIYPAKPEKKQWFAFLDYFHNISGYDHYRRKRLGINLRLLFLEITDCQRKLVLFSKKPLAFQDLLISAEAEKVKINHMQQVKSAIFPLPFDKYKCLAINPQQNHLKTISCGIRRVLNGWLQPVQTCFS